MRHASTYALLPLLSILAGSTHLAAQPVLVERYARTYDSGEEDASPTVRASRQLVDGTWVVVSTGARWYLDRLADDGQRLSSHTVDGGWAASVAIDPFGNALFLLDGGFTAAPRVHKVEAASGRTIWRGELDLSPGAATSVSLVSGEGGDVFLVGRYRESVSRYAPFAAKLDGATGKALWGPHVFFWGTMGERVLAALDPRGDLFLLALQAPAPNARAGTLLRKLGAGTGASLWSTFLDPGLPGGALRFELAVTPSGDPIVASQHGVGSGQTHALVKVEGRAGRPLWQVFVGRHVDSNEELRLLPDESGGLFLAFPSALVRLRSRDGQREWEAELERPLRAAAALRGGDVLTLVESDVGFRLRRLGRVGGTDLWPPLAVESPSRLNTQQGALLSVGRGSGLVATRDPGAAPAIAERTRLALLAVDAGRLTWGPMSLFRRQPLRPSLDTLVSGIGGEVFALVSGPREEVRVARLSPSSGDLVWLSESFPGLVVARLLADRRGDVFLVGSAGSTGVLLKLQGSSGTLLWGPIRYDGSPLSPGIRVLGAEVDPGGDLLVAVSMSPANLVALKVAGDSGTVLWTSEAIPAGPGDWGGRILLDAAGNPFLLISGTAGSRAVVLATRLAGSTGERLWGPSALVETYRPLSAAAAADGLALLVVGPEGDAASLRVSGETGEVTWGPLTEPDTRHYAYGLLSAVLANEEGDVFIILRTTRGVEVRRRRGLTGEEVFLGTWLGPIADAQLDDAAFDVEGNLLISVTYRGSLAAGTRTGRILSALLTFDGQGGGFAAQPLVEHSLRSGRRVLPVAEGVLLGQDSLRLLAPDLAILPLGPLGLAGGEPVDVPVPLANAAPPVELAIVGGSLPPGMGLRDGRLYGQPNGQGPFNAVLAATDASGRRHEREVELNVGRPSVPVFATGNPICAGGTAQLGVEGDWASFRWGPSGETTPGLVVSPLETTTYLVEVADVVGRVRQGSATVFVAGEDGMSPAVTAPPPLALVQSACDGRGRPGATPRASPSLAAFLESATATDSCDPLPSRLPAQVEGEDAAPDTFFPAGDTAVSFRFRDATGNEGQGSGVITIRALGDLDLSRIVDVFDLVTLAGYLVGSVAPGAPPFRAPEALADVDRNGHVDVFDLVTLAGHLAGNVGCLSP